MGGIDSVSPNDNPLASVVIAEISVIAILQLNRKVIKASIETTGMQPLIGGKIDA